MTARYIRPLTTAGLPLGLNVTQFIQTVLVGVTGLQGDLVRPQWQTKPPKQPALETNWMAFGIVVSNPSANSYVGVNAANATISKRVEKLEVICSFYGPDAMENAGLMRDGFQIQQNLDALKSANMGFTEVTEARHVPDLVNELFVNRAVCNLVLQREVQRTYPIVTLLSATGTVHTVLGNEEYLLNWQTPEEI